MAQQAVTPLEHFLRLDGPADQIVIHQPDINLAFQPNVSIAFNQSSAANIPEKMRMMLLAWMRDVIKDRKSEDKIIYNALYRFSKEILYWMIFDVFHGRTNNFTFQLIGCMALLIAYRTDFIYSRNMTPDEYRTRPFDDPEKMAIDQKLAYYYNGLSISTANTYTPEQIKYAVDELDRTYLPDIQRLEASYGKVIRVLGSGSYGVVFKSPLKNKNKNQQGAEVEYGNDYVTKTFFRENNLEKVLNQSQVIRNLMNENAYRVERHSARTMSNISPVLYRKIREAKPTAKFAPNTELHAVRMPDLGISIYDVTQHRHHLASFRSCEFHIIMTQLYKCMSQLARFATRRYIHADIRPPNVMWKPDTGGIYIIDFDMMDDYDGFDTSYRAHLGHHSNPPETVAVYTGTATRNDKESKWLTNNFIVYGELFGAIYPGINTELDFKMMVRTINQDVRAFLLQRAAAIQGVPLEKALRQVIHEVTYPSFDSYSFAQVIADLFTYAYPGAMVPLDLNTVVHALSVRISDRGQPYEQEYLEHIVSTLFELRTLFVAMAELDVRQRIPAIQALDEMKRIYTAFAKGHNRIRPQATIDTKEVVAELAEAKEAVDLAIQQSDELTDEEHALLYAQRLFQEEEQQQGGMRHHRGSRQKTQRHRARKQQPRKKRAASRRPRKD